MARALLAAVIAAAGQIGYFWTFGELTTKADAIVIAEPLKTVEIGSHDEPGSDARPIPFADRRTDLKVLAILKQDSHAALRVGSEIHLQHRRVDVEEFRRRNPPAPGQPPPGLVNTGSSLNFDSNPGSYLLFLKRLADGDYEPLSGLTFPTDSVYMLLPTARQTAWGRRDALADVAAELRAVQDDDEMSGPIPLRARQLIPALRRELATRAIRALDHAPGAPLEQVEAYLRADLDAALAAGVSDAAAGPYGHSVDVRLRAVPGASDVVIAAVRIQIKCGSDTSLHVFRRWFDSWTPVTTLASRPSASIADAWGSLDYAAQGDGHGGFVLAVADVNPWCTSNWQSLRYRVYRSTQSGVREAFADRRTIYIGVDDPVFTITLEGRRLELRFEAESLKEPGDTDEHRVVYDIDPAAVRRVAEVPRRLVRR